MDGNEVVLKMLRHYEQNCKAHVSLINEQYLYNNKEKAQGFRRRMFIEYLDLSDVACEFVSSDEVKATMDKFRNTFEYYEKKIVRR